VFVVVAAVVLFLAVLAVATGVAHWATEYIHAHARYECLQLSAWAERVPGGYRVYVRVRNVGTDPAVVLAVLVDGEPHEVSGDGALDIGRFTGGDQTIEAGEEDLLALELGARGRVVEVKIVTAGGGEYATYVWLP